MRLHPWTHIPPTIPLLSPLQRSYLQTHLLSLRPFVRLIGSQWLSLFSAENDPRVYFASQWGDRWPEKFSDALREMAVLGAFPPCACGVGKAAPSHLHLIFFGGCFSPQRAEPPMMWPSS